MMQHGDSLEIKVPLEASTFLIRRALWRHKRRTGTPNPMHSPTARGFCGPQLHRTIKCSVLRGKNVWKCKYTSDTEKETHTKHIACTAVSTLLSPGVISVPDLNDISNL